MERSKEESGRKRKWGNEGKGRKGGVEEERKEGRECGRERRQ